MTSTETEFNIQIIYLGWMELNLVTGCVSSKKIEKFCHKPIPEKELDLQNKSTQEHQQISVENNISKQEVQTKMEPTNY